MVIIAVVLVGLSIGIIVVGVLTLLQIWNIVQDCYDPLNHKWRS